MGSLQEIEDLKMELLKTTDWGWERDRYLKTFEIINRWKGKKVLDIGCKWGHFSKLMALNGNEVTGIDLNNYSENFKGVGNFYQHDLETGLPTAVKDNRFDTIIMNGVLEHVENMDTLLKDIYLALEEGGEFVVAVPTEKLNKSGDLLLRFQWVGSLFNFLNYLMKPFKFLKRYNLFLNLYQAVNFPNAALKSAPVWEKEHLWKKEKKWWEERFKENGFNIKELQLDKPEISYFFFLTKNAKR